MRSRLHLPQLVVVAGVLLLASLATADEFPSVDGDLYQSLLEITDAIENRWARYDLGTLRVLASSAERIHPLALQHSSEFMEELLALFDASGSLRRRLMQKPIRYVFATGPTDVQMFTGIDSDGVALVEHQLVVSRRFPHEHELAHIVAHMALAPDKASGTAPVVREGLASYLGGARGCSSAVTLALGDAYLDLRVCVPSQLLSHTEFYAGWRDPAIAYAVSARWVEFLVETEGWERFARIYWLLSAAPDHVGVMPAAAVALQFEGVYERDWAELVGDFNSWRRRHPSAAVKRAVAPLEPAQLDKTLENRRIRMWQRDGEWLVQLRAERGYPEARLQWGETVPPGLQSGMLALSAGEPTRRYELSVGPNRIQLTDLLLDRILQASTPFALQGTLDESSEPPREVSVRLPWLRDKAPQWPKDPVMWVSPLLH